MFNFLNSPPGPAGAAGQASSSTQPPNLFSNASPQFGRFGMGMRGFGERMGGGLRDMIQSLLRQTDGGFGKLGEGLGQIPGALGEIPGNVAKIPGSVASILGGQGGGDAAGNSVAPTAPAAPSQGILSRFLGGGQ